MPVGAAFRVERRLDMGDRRAEPGQHRLDDVIAADQQPVAGELGRQVAIAEMPGDADQMGGVARTDLGQRFGRRPHRDDAAVLQHQAVAVAKRRRFRQVEQEFETALAGHRQPAAMAVVMVENHRVGGGAGPMAGGQDLRGADHQNRKYRCAIGSTSAGAQVSNSPSARTS